MLYIRGYFHSFRFNYFQHVLLILLRKKLVHLKKLQNLLKRPDDTSWTVNFQYARTQFVIKRCSCCRRNDCVGFLRMFCLFLFPQCVTDKRSIKTVVQQAISLDILICVYFPLKYFS